MRKPLGKLGEAIVGSFLRAAMLFPLLFAAFFFVLPEPQAPRSGSPPGSQ
jgi:hypothetical protein